MLAAYLRQREKEKETLWDKVDIRNPKVLEMKKNELQLIENDITKTADLMVVEGLKISEDLHGKGQLKEQADFLRQLAPFDASRYKIKTEFAITNSEIAAKDNDPIKLKESLDAFKEAIAANPDYHKAQKHIGLAYKHLGMKLLAREHLEKYLDLLDTIISKLRLASSDEGIKEASKLQADKEKIQAIINTL